MKYNIRGAKGEIIGHVHRLIIEEAATISVRNGDILFYHTSLEEDCKS